MIRVGTVLRRGIEIGVAALAAWLLWTSFETGRQLSVGMQSKFGVSLQLWDGRVGVLYQAEPTTLPGGGLVIEPLVAPAALFEEDRASRARVFDWSLPNGVQRVWKFRYEWRPAGTVRFSRLPDTFEADAPAWPIAALAALPLAARAARRRRSALRRQRGECVACGYQVRDLPICPECGTPVEPVEALSSDVARLASG